MLKPYTMKSKHFFHRYINKDANIEEKNKNIIIISTKINYKFSFAFFEF